MIGRNFIRLSCATAACALAVGIGVHAQPQQPPAPAPGAPTAAEKYKNIQVLKGIPADQLPNTMQYVAAALGVQCGFCHVQGPDGWHFEVDDRPAKATARKMITMMNTFNGAPGNDITLTCATCHHGRGEPERTPPLAQDMTPDEIRVAQQRAAARGTGGGAPPQGPPVAAGRQGPGAPGAAPGGGRGPQRPTETVEEVLAKYVQALGGSAVAQAKSRVMQGTVTGRDQQTNPVKVQEKASGEYRIDIDAKPAPIIRAYSGKSAWIQAFGNVHEQDGVRGDQIHRLADLGLATDLKQRFSSVSVGRYANVDGTPTISLVARGGDVTEQLQFARDSGLLLRRSISTRTPLGNLLEQVDYRAYRDAGGIKTPFEVRYATWNEVSTLKFTDVKYNAPVDEAVFVQPK